MQLNFIKQHKFGNLIHKTSFTMNNKSKSVRKQFAEEMRRCCLERYPTIPSYEKLSKDFYYSTNYTLNVNRETFRKWLKGESFPDLDHLLYLIEWLNLNLDNIFKLTIKKPSSNLNLCYFEKNLINNLNQDSLDLLIYFINTMKEQINNNN